MNRWTFWEGGVNVACFLSGPALPQARRGTVWPGLAHVSDWYLLLRFSFQSSDNTKDMHWSQVLDSVCWCGGWQPRGDCRHSHRATGARLDQPLGSTARRHSVAA